MNLRIPIVMQMQVSDNGAAALCMMLGYFGRHVDLREMRGSCASSRNGSSPEQVCRAAGKYGLDAEIKSVPAQELYSLSGPLLVTWKKKYYAIVLKMGKRTVTLQDPSKGRYELKTEKFLASYGGRVIRLAPNETFAPGGRAQSAWSLLKARILPFKGGLLVLALLSCASVFLTMFSLTLRRHMLDDVMSGTDRGAFSWLFALMAAVWLCSVLLSAVYHLGIYRLSRKMAAASGSVLYKKLFRLPMSYYEKANRGELMERIDMNNSLDNDLITSLVPKIFNCVSLLFYLVLIYTYNAGLSTCLLLLQLIFALAIFRVQQYSIMVSRSRLSINESMRASLMNGLNCIDTIKASGSEGKFFHLWNSQMGELQSANGSSIRLTALQTMLQTAQSVCSSAMILFLGAWLIIRGQFTLGMLSCMQSVFNSVAASLSSAMSTEKYVNTTRTNLERIDDILEWETLPEIPLGGEDSPEKLDGSVEVSHLTYRYNEGDAPAVEDISFTISPGEMVALVGQSGCGKSTLMKIIAGTYQVQEGSVTYAGRSRDQIPDVVFHASIASVDQEVNMFEGTLRENLKMWDPSVEDFEMILAARDAQIHQRIIQNFDGYDSAMQSNGSNYSGGEQQRLELSRALAQEPTLLILDEFTSALDALTEEKVFHAIRSKGTACLIAAHRLSTIVECDKVIVIEGGRIVETGTPAQLYEKKGLYYRMVALD